MSQFKIVEQPNAFHDHLLDIIGNEFKFDHAKGLAEWLKNSSDAYNRAEVSDEDQFIIIRLKPKTPLLPPRFECIDFVGMTHDEIDTAFKKWGDPNAAARGKSSKKILGGHGNGGKFYMRQMFDESRFITYRDGFLNVFGFNEHKRYGFDKKYEKKKEKLERAIDLADLEDVLKLIPRILKTKLEKGKIGFTIVTGENPEKMRGRNTPRSIIQRLRVHPQARRLLKSKQVFAIIDNQIIKLEADNIPPREGFEGPFEYDLPPVLLRGSHELEFANEKYPAGKLSLFTSAEPFTRLGDRASLNCIDIRGEIGVIGSYRMHELGHVKNFTETEFIYGECSCPILENPKEDCVRNDREKLVENDKTQALLEWICGKVNELADKMAAKSVESQRVEELRQSSVFNEFLNSWMRKSKFWEKLRGEIFGGPDAGGAFGGEGGGGEAGPKGDGDSDGDGAKSGDEGNDGGGAGDKKKQGPKFPDVRLSNVDSDPLGLTPTVNCDPRHPLIYQRPEDVPQGIYWINSQSPFAKKVLEVYTSESTRWREYMFQRHIDILVKQSVYEMERREPHLSAARIDNDVLDRVARRIYEVASVDTSLSSFLFNENLSGVQSVQQDEKQVEPTETATLNP
jgi:hypothetical protein